MNFFYHHPTMKYNENYNLIGVTKNRYFEWQKQQKNRVYIGKTHLLKLFVTGITIGSDPGVVPSLFPVREPYSGEESSPKYCFEDSVSWLETLFVPHFKHFTLSVGLIWPQVWQCHCSTDAIEPILIHTWLGNHNSSAFFTKTLCLSKMKTADPPCCLCFTFLLGMFVGVGCVSGIIGFSRLILFLSF